MHSYWLILNKNGVKKRDRQLDKFLKKLVRFLPALCFFLSIARHELEYFGELSLPSSSLSFVALYEYPFPRLEIDAVMCRRVILNSVSTLHIVYKALFFERPTHIAGSKKQCLSFKYRLTHSENDCLKIKGKKRKL